MRRASPISSYLGARLVELVAERDRADLQIRRNVRAARMENASWSEIGECLGMTAQGAQQRYKADAPIALNRSHS